MRRTIPLLVLVSLWVAIQAPRVEARVNVHIGVGVPPPPVVVFEHEPAPVLVPQTEVYYVPGTPDYDVYRYGPYWYVNRDGYWYRASGYRGPFAPIPYERVPHAIVVVPQEYHHHPFRHVGNPGPGHVERHDHHDGHDGHDARGHGPGRGPDHGHEHEHEHHD